MVSTKSWPSYAADVVDLFLDTQNVRLRSDLHYETDVLAYLYEHEDAIGLAQDIAQSGYFDNDLLIVTRENGQLVVLEGNRRLAALKGLTNPTSVPRFSGRLIALRNDMDDADRDALQSVGVKEAPDRVSAQLILATLHTKRPKKSWPREQQAAFYYNQMVEGKTIKELQALYPPVAAEIPDFIRFWHVYRFARDACSGDERLSAFLVSTRFKPTIFERLIESGEFRAMIGLRFTEEGAVEAIGNDAERDRILRQVVIDMDAKRIDTRKLPTQRSEAFKKYLASLRTGTPFPPKGGAEDVAGQTDTGSGGEPGKPDEEASHSGDNRDGQGEGEGSSGDQGGETSGEGGRNDGGPEEPRQRGVLDTSGIVNRLSPLGLKARYSELSSINYQKFPNATLDLLRTVLECALKEYLDQAGDPIPKGNKRYIMLKDAIVHALAHFEGKRNDRAVTILTMLNTIPQNEGQWTTSAAALNAVNHNPDVYIDRDKVRAVWTNCHGLLRILLAGPKEEPQAG